MIRFALGAHAQLLPALINNFAADPLKVLHLPSEVDRQEIVSDGDSEDDIFSDSESENESLL